MGVNEEYWEEHYRDAYWRHNGDPQRPHAILTSLNHSDGYFDCSKIVSRPALLQASCRAILDRVHLKTAPDWVVGSAFGSILVAYQLAKLLSCRAGFTERPATGALVLKRFEIAPEEPALVVATTLPASGAVEATVAALRAKGCTVIPQIAVIVNLTSLTSLKGYPIVAPTFPEVSCWLPNAKSSHDPCGELTSYPASLEQACRQVASRLDGTAVRWVVGAGTDAILTAFELASQLDCRAAFTEPESSGDLALSRFHLEGAARVLVCEDVLTTGGTTTATIAAVERGGAEVLEYLCAIANRSGSPALGKREIVSLLAPQFSVWKPDACPLCQQGSTAVRPKGNWAQLTQP